MSTGQVSPKGIPDLFAYVSSHSLTVVKSVAAYFIINRESRVRVYSLMISGLGY